MVTTHRLFRAALLALGIAGGALVATGGAQPMSSRQTPGSSDDIDPVIRAVAASVGPSTDALLARVSDGVVYEMYPGVFRGAAATLADGAGNDLDKALLLAALIRASNARASVRFASCTLPPERRDALVAAAKAAYRRPRVLAEFAGRVASRAATPQGRAFFEQMGAVWTGLGIQNRDESAQLAAALQAAHAPAPSPSAGDLRAIVSHHTWVQEQTAAGAWQDLDPTLPHAKPGASLCAADATTAALPAAAYDTVTARVRVERRASGSLDDQTALEHTWRTADLARSSLTFAFAEPADVSVAGSPEPAGFDRFTPVFLVDATTIAGTPVLVPDLDTAAKAASSLGAGIASVFGQPAAPAAPAKTSPDASELAAMWLQVVVTAPGVAPETIESAIVDRVGYADRVAGRAATAPLAKLDDAKGMYPAFGTVWNVAASLGTATVGAGDGGPAHPVTRDAAGVVRSLASAHRTYDALRLALFAEASGAGAPPIIRVRPGVSLVGIVWRSGDGASAAPVASLVMDLASDHALPDGAAPEAAIRWGTSSLLAEREVTNARPMMSAVAKGGPVTDAPMRDVFSVFAAARASGAPVLVRTDRDVPASVSPDATARLAQSLAGGAVALAPAGPVGANREYGWWIVGPDGGVRDEMQNGRHQEEEGYLARVWRAVRQSPRIRQIGCAVFAAGFSASVAGAAVAEGGEAAEYVSESSEILSAEKELLDKEKEFDEVAKTCGELGGGNAPPPPPA
jgi:hypothetical protein